jgi:glutaminyl-peptide cyclotransferase
MTRKKQTVQHRSTMRQRRLGIPVSVLSVVVAAFALILIIFLVLSVRNASSKALIFDGRRALQDVEYQVSLGPRIMGSEAHQTTLKWIQEQLKNAGWGTEVQETVFAGHQIQNVIGKLGSGTPWIILGAHFDSRLYANHDPDVRKTLEPVPGANDGASGVAVLLEIARVLPQKIGPSGQLELIKANQVWLVFFDAEDNGNIPGWDWILGSQAFAGGLQEHPDAAIIVDMIGDKNLNIYMEKNSDPLITQQIWSAAENLGYSKQFIPYPKYAILDDHIPFKRLNIPAVDIIDFEYPYWHTTADTADKLSPESLQIVGETLLSWFEGG